MCGRTGDRRARPARWRRLNDAARTAGCGGPRRPTREKEKTARENAEERENGPDMAYKKKLAFALNRVLHAQVTTVGVG